MSHTDTYNKDIEYGSWSDHIKSITKSKKSLSWSKAEINPLKFITRHEMSRKERVFDPILQKYRNPDRERNVNDTKKVASIKSLNKARDFQLKFSQTFDIVNHSSKLPGGDPPGESRPKKLPDSRTPWNILSNLDTSEHYSGAAPKFVIKTPREGGKRTKAMKPPRDYNVVSNRYLFGHREKVTLDKQYERHRAAVRFWQTHDANPLTSEYFDSEKEDDFISKRNMLNKTHGSNHVTKLPGTYQLAEGVCYDILSMNPKDSDRMQIRESLDNKKYNNALIQAFEERTKAREMYKADLRDKRALNRISDERLSNSIRHGFNIVNNISFDGMNGKPVPQVHKRKHPAWDRIIHNNGATDVLFKAIVPETATLDTARIKEIAEQVRAVSTHNKYRGTLIGRPHSNPNLDSTTNVAQTGIRFKSSANNIESNPKLSSRTTPRIHSASAVNKPSSATINVPRLQLSSVRTGGF